MTNDVIKLDYDRNTNEMICKNCGGRYETPETTKTQILEKFLKEFIEEHRECKSSKFKFSNKHNGIVSPLFGEY